MLNNLQRPNNFKEYVGQECIISNLQVYINSSLKQKNVLDHILIYGQSGMGKTTLANIIASEMNRRIIILNGPALSKPSDIISPLTALKENDLIFIDEVHSLPKDVMEVIYPVLESNELSVIFGKDYNSKVIKIKLKPFTMICATTEINKLPFPFINRFPINFHLEPYNEKEITTIIFNFANKINLNLSQRVSEYLSCFTKLNPRIAINIVKRLNDYITIEEPNQINEEYVSKTLKKLQIYKYGLNKTDINYLEIIFKYGVVGIDTLSQITELSSSILMNVIEPTLIKNYLIIKTFKGRKMTQKGVELINEIKKT